MVSYYQPYWLQSNELEHYGVKGMRWGVRNEKEDISKKSFKDIKLSDTSRWLRSNHGIANNRANVTVKNVTVRKVSKTTKPVTTEKTNKSSEDRFNIGQNRSVEELRGVGIGEVKLSEMLDWLEANSFELPNQTKKSLKNAKNKFLNIGKRKVTSLNPKKVSIGTRIINMLQKLFKKK